MQKLIASCRPSSSRSALLSAVLFVVLRLPKKNGQLSPSPLRLKPYSHSSPPHNDCICMDGVFVYCFSCSVKYFISVQG